MYSVLFLQKNDPRIAKDLYMLHIIFFMSNIFKYRHNVANHKYGEY